MFEDELVRKLIAIAVPGYRCLIAGAIVKLRDSQLVEKTVASN